MKKDYILPDIKEARKRNKTDETIRVLYNIDDKYLNLGKGKKYFIKTHGCQANFRDSETIAGLLNELNYQKASNQEEADIVLINTCAIREGAEDKVFGEIGALKRLKAEKRDMLIGICGCMAQEEKTVNTLLAKYHQVDLIFGTHNITSLPKMIYDIYNEHKQRIVEVYSKQGEVIENVPVTRLSSHKAYVNIMYGCDKFCTYCIVPYTRGKERSRYLEDVVNEVINLKQSGYKEVCLLGQNVNAYGKDLGLGYDFATLLNEVAKTGINRIRFMTSHPWDFNDDMILAIKNNKNICPYIHLPVQSGSNNILKKMNRRYTIEEYKDLFTRLNANLDNFAYTTDIIVGFPNESDKDFKDTLDIVDFCKYDNAFTFIYSPRSGTPAAVMKDEIKRETKEKRLQELNKKVAYYANMKNQKYLNQIVEVLVDGKSKKNDSIYSGYTRDNKLVNFKADKLDIGNLVNVKITECMSFSLNGEFVGKIVD